jgi:hypothetical protein
MTEFKDTQRLKDGKDGERIVGTYLALSLGYSKVEYAPDYNFPDWDIKAIKDNNYHYFEVKNDLMVKHTGNIFVEFYNTYYLRNAGALVSRADHVVFITNLNPLQMIFVRHSVLFDYIRVKGYKAKSDAKYKIVQGGENNNALGFLVPLSEIKKIGEMHHGT